MTSTTKSSRTTSYTYDAFDNVLTESNTGLGTVSYQYDLGGRRKRLMWPDSVYITYDWDAASNLKDIKLSGSSSIVSFAYDSLGRRVSLSRNVNGLTTYSYDAKSVGRSWG